MSSEELDLGDLARMPSDPEPTPTDLSSARIEANTLLGDKERQAHRREQELKNALHNSILFFLKCATWMAIVLLGIRCLLLVVPSCWVWLNEDQISTLDTLAIAATTGALGSQVGKYISKGMETSPP